MIFPILPSIVVESNKQLTITPTAIGTSSLTVLYIDDDGLTVIKNVEVIAQYVVADDGPIVLSTSTDPLFIRDAYDEGCTLSKVIVCNEVPTTSND